MLGYGAKLTYGLSEQGSLSLAEGGYSRNSESRRRVTDNSVDSNSRAVNVSLNRLRHCRRNALRGLGGILSAVGSRAVGLKEVLDLVTGNDKSLRSHCAKLRLDRLSLRLTLITAIGIQVLENILNCVPGVVKVNHSTDLCRIDNIVHRRHSSLSCVGNDYLVSRINTRYLEKSVGTVVILISRIAGLLPIPVTRLGVLTRVKPLNEIIHQGSGIVGSTYLSIALLYLRSLCGKLVTHRIGVVTEILGRKIRLEGVKILKMGCIRVVYRDYLRNGGHGGAESARKLRGGAKHVLSLHTRRSSIFGSSIKFFKYSGTPRKVSGSSGELGVGKLNAPLRMVEVAVRLLKRVDEVAYLLLHFLGDYAEISTVSRISKTCGNKEVKCLVSTLRIG